MSGAVAAAKAIGEDIETLVVDAVAGLEAETADDAHHDAVVTELLAPSLTETTVPVTWAGMPLVEPGTKVEIKACKRWTSISVSGGTVSTGTRGRWRRSVGPRCCPREVWRRWGASIEVTGGESGKEDAAGRS